LGWELSYCCLSRADNTMEQPRSEGKFWPSFALVSLCVMLLAVIRWSLEHPYGVHWDEALYLNQSHIDVLRLHNWSLLTLAKGFLIDDTGRPPAFRMLAFPVLILFGFHTAVARLVSLGCYAASCWFIYRTTRLLTGALAAAFAVLIFALSPEVISASAFFGTDAPLYLATSAMFYYMVAYWSKPAEHPRSWVGLGLAIGLGFLSKTSFLVIAVPALIVWLVAGYFRKFDVPSVFSQWKAAVVLAVIAVPWWVLNIQSAMAYTKYARGFVRNSLGPPSPSTWMRWLDSVIQCLLGPGVAVLIFFVVLLLFLQKFFQKKEFSFDPLQKMAGAACILAGGPLLLAQLTGTNHLLRHISPVVIPLGILVGLLVHKTEWGAVGTTSFVSVVLLAVQMVMLLTPVVHPNNSPVDLGFVNGAVPWRTLSRFEQWDWTPVRDLSDRCGLKTPKIAFLGSGRVFNPPAILFPWLERRSFKRRTPIDLPSVKWLWRYEHGPIDWQKVMDLSSQSDIVLTPPSYVGEVKNKEDLDNQHNAEFAARLSRDLDFQGPLRLQLGRFAPVEMDLFVKNSLGCPAVQSVQAAPQQP
jgi:4-amino-4-deoxy-L-arabinose transferase-like glycosyltransferase